MHIHDLALLGQGPTRGDSWRLRLSAGAPLQTSAESRGANARDHHDYAQRPARYGRSTGRTSARRGRRRRGSLRSGLETTGRVAARKCECRAPAPTAVGAAELDRDGEKEPQRRHVKVGALPFTTTGRSRLSCGAWSAQRVGFELLTHASCGRHVRCPAGDNRGGFWGVSPSDTKLVPAAVISRPFGSIWARSRRVRGRVVPCWSAALRSTRRGPHRLLRGVLRPWRRRTPV